MDRDTLEAVASTGDAPSEAAVPADFLGTRSGSPARRDPAPSSPLPDEVVPTFEEVARRYGGMVYTLAYRLTGDPDEAADLAQDVFVRVYRNLDRYRPGSFEGWLYRITRNLFLDRVRRRRRIRLQPLPEEDWRHPEEAGPGPAEHAETAAVRGRIDRALAQLPPEFRTAVVLCDVQGLTYREVAEVTGWPLGTVRSRIHRGRRALRGLLDPDERRGRGHG